MHAFLWHGFAHAHWEAALQRWQKIMEGPGLGVEVSLREDGETLPLIVRPKDGNDSLTFLQNWIARNTSWLDQKLLDHGKS